MVGAGGHGFKLLSHLLESPDRWELVGVADPFPTAYARLQSAFYDKRVPVVRSARELPALGPQAVLVTTTASAHVPAALDLIAAGHEGAILIEKPVSNSVAAARRLAAAAETFPGRIAIDFQRRASEMYRELKRTLESGELGAVQSIRFRTLSPDKISMTGSHHFDLAGWLAGSPPVEVRGDLLPEQKTDRRGTRYYDPAGVAEVRYANGATLELDARGQEAKEDAGLVVTCEQGQARVDAAERRLVIEGQGSEPREVATDAGPTIFHWIEAALHELMHGSAETLATPAEGAASLEAIVGAFRSNAAGGEPVALPLGDEAAAEELLVA